MSSWILLRGLMREARHWGDFPQTLASGLGGATVVPLDLPGNGSLHALRSPTQIAGMTEHCRAQLQQRGIALPYNLLALSLGAMVAGDWATRYPAEIERAVLINTSMRPFSPFYHRLRPRNYLTLLRTATNPAVREQTILHLTSNRPPPSGLLDQWQHYGKQNPVSPANVWRQLLAALRYRASPQAPDAALLILCGSADRLVNPRCSAMLAQQWQASLQRHPHAGHDLTLDAADWVVQQVHLWLNGDMQTITNDLPEKK